MNSVNHLLKRGCAMTLQSVKVGQASSLPRERVRASDIPLNRFFADGLAICRAGRMPALRWFTLLLECGGTRNAAPLSSAAHKVAIARLAPVLAFSLFAMLAGFPNLGHATTRSSANYSISAETIDGGGAPASSVNYSSVASVEPAAIGTSTSSDYQIQHGYFAARVVAVAVLVEGRWVFYNHSAWDDNDPSANANDDSAIATDKSALLPGGTATFANYSSYDKGINGIMVDIANLPGTPTASDFTFKTGNDNSPSGWAIAPDPVSITVRAGAGRRRFGPGHAHLERQQPGRRGGRQRSRRQAVAASHRQSHGQYRSRGGRCLLLRQRARRIRQQFHRCARGPAG